MIDEKAFEYYSILFKWLEIRSEGGLEFPSSIDQLKITMMKSALLNRLLKGKEAFPHPPPKKYSYPWYALIENGEDIATDVWKADGWVGTFYDSPTLMICQFPWRIVKEIAEDSWLVNYDFNFFGGTKATEDTWHVYKQDDYWIIKKINA